MRIESIILRNFKRFTDLKISGIPETAKLVLIVGPNGSGKSSLFDAFQHWYRFKTGFGILTETNYFRKQEELAFSWENTVEIELHGTPNPTKGMFYLRSAYRNEPDFSISGISKPQNPSASIRVSRAIDNDQVVSENYRRLVYETISGVYDSSNDAKSVLFLRNELIGEIRASMQRVFGDLLLSNISDPLGDGSFSFSKGSAKHYHFKNLSGGEKAAFDLLLDLHMKKRFFLDSIYCIDEVETHLHTRVQGSLVKELVQVLPNSCQLWLTTHSLGVLRAAQELSFKEPDTVCVIDFDGIDPDIPREIIPSSLNRIAWEKMLSITLDDLSDRMAPRAVVVCEGSSTGSSRKDFDAEIYNRIFNQVRPDILFVSGGSSNHIINGGTTLKSTLSKIIPGAKIFGLIDRDSKTETEISQLESAGTFVLKSRNLESYLFEEDVLAAFLERRGKLLC